MKFLIQSVGGLKPQLLLFRFIFCSSLLTFWVHAGKSLREWAPEPPPPWAREAPFGAAKITALDVICGKEHMTVRAEFSAPFQGIVFSKGTYGQENCIYIKANSGVTHATFNVQYDKCGTKPDLQGKYYENTIVIQYGTDIIEAYDEAKRLRCEWFEAYEKPATFRPAIPVADLDVIEMTFQGDEIDCWMSIQEGKGPWAREVSRIVPVGQPMTIVIAINDYNGQFDMRVKSCFAHDGVKPAIHLTDEYGCVLRPKMLTPFNKIRDSTGKATLISYAQFLAFKFPDTMDVQIQCTVEVCRHGCAEACHKESNGQPIHPPIHVSAGIPHSTSTHGKHAQVPHVPPQRKPEDEPQSQFQDISTVKVPHSRIPAASESEHISHHSPQYLDSPVMDVKPDSAYDHEYINPVYKETYTEVSEVQSQPQPDYYTPDFGHQQMASQNKPFQSHQIIEENAHPSNSRNPEIKDQSNDKSKKPIIELINPEKFRPSDIEHATKMLSNLGIKMDNVNFGNFAANFMQNMQQQEISSLLQNEKIKDLAAKFGHRISNQKPYAAALSTHEQTNTTESTQREPESSILRPADINDHPSHSQSETMKIESVEIHRNPEPHTQQLIQSKGHHSQVHVHQQHHHQQHHQHHSHIKPQQNIGHASMESIPRPNFPQTEAVTQVLNVPLQPGGIPMMQVLPNNAKFHAQKPLIAQHPHHSQFPPPPNHGFQHYHPSNGEIIKNNIDKRTDLSHDVPFNVRLIPQSQFPHGPRSLRLRRSITGSSGEIGVRKGFQVVTSVDLAFLPNVTTDSAPVYSGRREDIIYGVCMSVAGFAAGLSCILWLIVAALASTACMIFKLDRHKKSLPSND